MKILLIAIIAVAFQQYIQLIYGVPCSANPCQIVPGIYDGTTGHCCIDIPNSTNNSVCICPNNIPPVINGPCRPIIAQPPLFCNLTCLNNGVCNIVNDTQVCYCPSGYSGVFCQLQGIPTRCSVGICGAGTCVEERIGTTIYAYCLCNPGFTGIRCTQCYFTCSQIGAFPDLANCQLGRYFYCPATTGAPIAASCPPGQKYNRLIGLCDPTYNCI